MKSWATIRIFIYGKVFDKHSPIFMCIHNINICTYICVNSRTQCIHMHIYIFECVCLDANAAVSKYIYVCMYITVVPNINRSKI